MIRVAVKSRSHCLSGGLVALALLTVPNADKIDCSNVADRYKAAVAQIVDALRSYATCVAASDKRDDCAAEMQALDDAHDDFADAVADSKSCR